MKVIAGIADMQIGVILIHMEEFIAEVVMVDITDRKIEMDVSITDRNVWR